MGLHRALNTKASAFIGFMAVLASAVLGAQMILSINPLLLPGVACIAWGGLLAHPASREWASRGRFTAAGGFWNRVFARLAYFTLLLVGWALWIAAAPT